MHRTRDLPAHRCQGTSFAASCPANRIAMQMRRAIPSEPPWVHLYGQHH